MNIREMQTVMAAVGYYTAGVGYYTAGIDGDYGDKSLTAQLDCERDGGYSIKGMSEKRRRVAAVQWCLNELGHEAGAVDGYEGHNTREALNSFLYALANGKGEVVPRTPTGLTAFSKDVPRQRDVKQFYGDPSRGEAYMYGKMVTIELPFKLRIDYNLRQRTNKITVHKLAAPSLLAALIAVHDHYGIDRMRELGIDRYAGALNHRRMRGGDEWSMHAYGCAIDFYAAPNGLRMKCPKALFCGPEYKAFLDIMEAHGWHPAIRLWGADAMHFQRATM